MSIELADRYFIVCASLLIILVAYANSLCADSLINIPVDNEIYAFSDDIYDFVARLAAKGIITDFPGYIFGCNRIKTLAFSGFILHQDWLLSL